MNLDEFGYHIEKFLGIIHPEKEVMLEEDFKEIDLNGDGKITLEELLKIARETFEEVPESVVRTIFVLSDSDNSKSIDKREFVRFLRLALSV